MDDQFEERITDLAQHFPYPPFPLKKTVRPVRLSTTFARNFAAIVVVVGLIAVAIPDIRAAILEVLQIGNVTIYLDSLGADEEPLRLQDVVGETDLETAQSLLKFDMLVPLDSPDRVYVQNEDMVIMVWLNGETIEKVLYQVQGLDWGTFKGIASNPTPTEVAGHYAVWINVPHIVQFVYKESVQDELTYFIDGNVLIWERGRITYRLETHLAMEDAVEYADSLFQ